MADIFIEVLVTRKRGAAQYLQAVLYVLILLTVIVALMAFAGELLGTLLPFLVAGGGFLIWWLIRNQVVEFEYILTNGEIDIDRILGRSKRKRITTVDVRNFEVFAPYNAENFEPYRNVTFAKKFDAAGSNPDRMFAVTPMKNGGGKLLLIFQPNDRIIEAMKIYNHRLFK
ncbi:hypothetical protein FACS1894217_02330 [Clostridia bacterium]|nr:hypothetical protein FACS1894217_02330 [Clostridia bacterium]